MSDVHWESQEDYISVLILARNWQFDTHGLSTVNKSLVNNLRVVDPEGKKIKITCAVVEEEGKIQDEQRADAAKYKVELKGGNHPAGPKKKPTVEWLDKYTGAYYLDLVREPSYDFIIGHVPYLANGCFNFKDLYGRTGANPKVILMVHDIPETTYGDTDEKSLLQWLSGADVVFSVGKTVEAEIFPYIEWLDQQPVFKLYIPGVPVELFSFHHASLRGNIVYGRQCVTMMTGDKNDSCTKGLDFPLAFRSVIRASEHIRDFDVKVIFVLLSDNNEDREEWKKKFEKILMVENAEVGAFYFHSGFPARFEQWRARMEKSNLAILPYKPDSALFGTEALAAIAAGVPVLVSEYSGLASLLRTMEGNKSVVYYRRYSEDIETWKDRIIQKLVKPEESQRSANRLKEQLFLDTSIAQTHLDFINTVGGKICAHIVSFFICHYILVKYLLAINKNIPLAQLRKKF